MARYVCHFSAGAASAIAVKLTLLKSSDVINAFVKQEHEDNQRFLRDCEKWFGHPVTQLRDQKYDASTDEVWIKKRFMKGPRGAPCSKALKRSVLDTVAQYGDINILGFTVEEADRWELFRRNNPNQIYEAPLIDACLTKADCITMIHDAGIEIPAMYKLGFDNNNCIGCPKGGQNYWQHIRRHFPERFVQISNIQQSIGPGAYFLQFRSGPRAGQRMSLSELPEGLGNMRDEPDFSCSFYCAMALEDISDERVI